jgi:hypothetical protein
MARFDFQSPGAGATASIQDFIKQRNADERTALLDELNKRNIEHQMGIEDATLKINQNADVRATALQKENILKGRVPLLPHGRIDASRLSPDMQEYVGGLGLIQDDPGTGGEVTENPDSTQTGTTEGATFKSATRAPSRTYIGSQENQQTEAAQARIDELMKEPLIDDDTATIRALMMARAGVLDNVPASIAGPRPSVTPIQWNTGKALPTVTGERGTSFMELNPGPSAYFGGGGGTPQYVGTQGGVPVVFDPRKQTFTPVPVSGGGGLDGANGKIEAKPNNQRPPDIVPQQLWNELRQARMAQVGGARRQAGIDQATANIKSFAMSRGVSPQVMADVDDIIADEAERAAAGLPATPIPDILNRIPNITDQEKQQIASLLYGFLSN